MSETRHPLLPFGRRWLGLAVLLGTCAVSAHAQQAPPAADPHLDLDLLLVIAHSDDETTITPYLARVTFDQHKRVGVVFVGSGGGGPNSFGRERALSLGLARRLESERALAAWGIDQVYWLGERPDNGTSNPLTSLARWQHGSALERLVRIVRATRPEVILSWLPMQVIGENHGDHQAAGMLAAEAFDLAPDPTSFPEQLTAFGADTDGLTPWTPLKLYYFTDAFDVAFMAGTGPSFSIHEVSPSRHRTYASLAAEPLAHYATQFSSELGELFGVPLDELSKAMGAPAEADYLKKLTQGSSPFWFEPLPLLRARSRVGGDRGEDCFAGLARPLVADPAPKAVREPAFRLGGPWVASRRLAAAHHLDALAEIPDAIAVHPGLARVSIPLLFTNQAARPVTVRLVLDSAPPPGWKERSRPDGLVVPAGGSVEVVSTIDSPRVKTLPWKANYRAEVDGRVLDRLVITLQVTDWTMAQ